MTLRDIEIAEQAFKEFWTQEEKNLRMTKTEKDVYQMHLHQGFLKGFFTALDKVKAMLDALKTV